jgi:hypothetical protein
LVEKKPGNGGTPINLLEELKLLFSMPFPTSSIISKTTPSQKTLMVWKGGLACSNNTTDNIVVYPNYEERLTWLGMSP